jgi:hypothetical protein
MIIRARSSDIHNRIANHPDVKRNIIMAGHDPENSAPLDFSECASRPDYALLHNGADDTDPYADCALLFDGIPHVGIWEQHSLVLPGCRGKKALNAARDMHRHMFEVEDALVIWGQTPVSNRAACMFNRWLGGTSRGFGDHYAFGPVEFFRLTRAEWEAHQTK